MLVIISDLHLTDGSLGDTVHEGALRVFRERLRHLAYAASWRAGGKYRPIESLTIVLLGDILDVLRSAAWIVEDSHCRGIRPWSDARDQRFAKKVDAITDGILNRNAVFFSLLRDLRLATFATVPHATGDGVPETTGQSRRSRGRAAVRVRIHYMVGNHDWYFHLPYPPYAAIRQKIVQCLGLENDPFEPFPHDPFESSAAAIRDAFDEHGVFARHGDVFDPVNYDGNRDAASLGDAIVTDLLLKFIQEIRRELNGALPPRRLAGFNEIDNVRPLLLAPVWIGSMLQTACLNPRLRRQAQRVWNDATDTFFHIPFVRDRLESRRSRLSLDKLRIALRISRRALLPGSDELLRWLSRRAGCREQSYSGHALRETAFQQGRARYFVYGHTHRSEMLPLDASTSFDAADARIYFNSGTWRPVYELARRQSGGHSFAGFNTMTYIAFFKGDERSGRTFETWSGNLCRSTAALAGRS